jgi:hypothetical protein
MRGNVRFQMLTYSITSSALAIECMHDAPSQPCVGA